MKDGYVPPGQNSLFPAPNAMEWRVRMLFPRSLSAGDLVEEMLKEWGTEGGLELDGMEQRNEVPGRT